VAIAQTSLASTFPSFWVYFQGLLFVLVIGFMPGGLASLPRLVSRLKQRRTGQPRGAAPASSPQVPASAVPAPATAATTPTTVPEEASR
jgi:urea transport system permease protein